MSASATATLRNTAVNSALPANLLGRFFNSAKENFVALAEAIGELARPATAGDREIRTLYRLSHGDSVNPKVLDALRKAQAAA